MSALDQRFRDHLTCIGLVAGVFLYGRQQYMGASALLAFSALLSINPSEVLQGVADCLRPYLYNDTISVASGTSASSSCSSSNSSQGLSCFEPILRSTSVEPEYEGLIAQHEDQSSDE
jgi:hypothetical protein